MLFRSNQILTVQLNLTMVFLDAFGVAAVLVVHLRSINTAVMVVKADLVPAAAEVFLTTPPLGVTHPMNVAKTQKFLSGIPTTWPLG